MASSIADLVWPVHTGRLDLRLAAARDADATRAYRRLESVSQWMSAWPRDRDESMHRSGEWLDGMSYALLAEEWRDPRA